MVKQEETIYCFCLTLCMSSLFSFYLSKVFQTSQREQLILLCHLRELYLSVIWVNEYKSSEIVLQDVHTENTSWDHTDYIKLTLLSSFISRRVNLLLDLLIDAFLQDHQTVPSISKEKSLFTHKSLKNGINIFFTRWLFYYYPYILSGLCTFLSL